MAKSENFIKGLEWQLEVEEKGIKDLEEKEAPAELIKEARTIRNRTAALVNSFRGPLAGRDPKPGCTFVRKGGGWLRGDE